MADVLPTKIRLTVVTRERKIVDLDVDEVLLPASDGEIGVLPGHTPLLTTLRVGILKYRIGNVSDRIVLAWGFAEVLPDRVIVIAEKGMLPGEIDPSIIDAERIQAERELASLASDDPDFVIAEARLEESVALINIKRDFL